MAKLKSKKGVATRKNYVVTNIRNSPLRRYAVIYRPQLNDYVVAHGYDIKDGTWAQGTYGFSTREKALKYTDSQVSKVNRLFKKRYPKVYASWKKKVKGK